LRFVRCSMKDLLPNVKKRLISITLLEDLSSILRRAIQLAPSSMWLFCHWRSKHSCIHREPFCMKWSAMSSSTIPNDGFPPTMPIWGFCVRRSRIYQSVSVVGRGWRPIKFGQRWTPGVSPKCISLDVLYSVDVGGVVQWQGIVETSIVHIPRQKVRGMPSLLTPYSILYRPPANGVDRSIWIINHDAYYLLHLTILA